MARGISFELFSVLNRILKVDETKGIYMHQLRRITDFYINKNRLEVGIASSMYTPLTEMYLVATNIEYSFSKNRSGTFISGINWNKPEVGELLLTLELGLTRSEKSIAEADRL